MGKDNMQNGLQHLAFKMLQLQGQASWAVLSQILALAERRQALAIVFVARTADLQIRGYRLIFGNGNAAVDKLPAALTSPLRICEAQLLTLLC